MSVFTVEILDKRGQKMLQELASRNWIHLQSDKSDAFLKSLQLFRKKASKPRPSLKRITGEVESVRIERYEKKKAKSNR